MSKILNCYTLRKFGVFETILSTLPGALRPESIDTFPVVAWLWIFEKKVLNNEEFAYIKWFVPRNFFMRFIDAVSVSKNYSGKFSFFINKLFFLESIFEKIKIYFIKKDYFHKTIGYSQPLRLLKKFKEIKFKDLSVSVPYFSEEYLKYVYGPNWKKPIKKYNWIKDSPSTKEV